MRTHLFAAWMAGAVVFSTFAGCNCGPGTEGDPDGGGSDAGEGVIGDGGTPVPLPGGGVCYTAACVGKVYECGNCQDDDNDGLIDSKDPDCLGPCHNDESSFDIGIQAAKGGNCDSLECYYDTNAGRGNDNCISSFSCDPLKPYPGCNGGYTYPNATYCPDTQPQMCLDTCQSITPNGCDCFGCCTVTLDNGTTRDIFLGSEDITNVKCKLDSVDDPNACRACTKNPSCGQGCGRCQLCIGKNPEDIPADCFTDAGTNPDQCPPDVQPCGLAGQAECQPNFFCLTGCCVQVLG